MVLNAPKGGLFVYLLFLCEGFRSIGFGLALNPKFSVSFGYQHHYIFPTDTEINNTTQSSNSLSIGALQMSLSYRLSRRLTLINSFEFGVTSDAPDMRLTVRAPYSF